MRFWIGLIWLNIRSSGGIFEHGVGLWDSRFVVPIAVLLKNQFL